MIRALLLDFDGTLVDTERLQWEAYRRTLAPYGVDVGLEEYREHWIRRAGGADYACRRYGLSVDPEVLKAQKTREYRGLLPAAVRPCPGVPAMLAAQRGRRRLAVVTNSERVEVEGILAHVGLAHAFDALVTREDYAHPKPAPDCYRTAAERLGLTPEECLVFEDTERGAAAGRAAGMRVVAVPSDLTYDNDFTGCIRRLDSLAEVSDALLDAIDGER